MLEKLTLNTMDEFKDIYNKSLRNESYDKDFFKLYDSQNFIIKYLYRKFLRLIKINNIVVGYIWYDAPIDKNIRIWALYIDYSIINDIDEDTLNSLDNSILSYEAFETNQSNIILKKLGFKPVRNTILMELNLNEYNFDNKIRDIYLNSIKRISEEFNMKMSKPTFHSRYFLNNKDESLRCSLQNEIFTEWNRKPLTIDDVYNDINQEYYLDNMSLFGMINNIYIGYGQVIYNRDMFTVVNFGIIEKYRGYGIGKLLLNDLILLCKKKGLSKLYIRVDEDNLSAKKLYRFMGFKDKSKVIKWERR
ncbi:GNAT family N-acetyltransferase [Clostridium carnis]